MGSPITITNAIGAEITTVNPFPGGTPLAVTSGNAANASAVATLPAVATRLNYLSGFDVTGSGATAGFPVVVTIAGLAAGTMTYTYAATAGVLVLNTPINIRLPVPLPASAVNIAITVTCPALGLGATNNVVNAFGYLV